MKAPLLRQLLLLFAVASAASALGCDRKGKGAPTKPSAAAASGSAHAGPPASGSAGAPSPSGSAAAAPTSGGSGTTEFVAYTAPGTCKEKSGDIGTYLQRGELAIAARENAVGVAWLIQLPNKPAAQVAFGGFDGEAKQLARGRGIGASRDYSPRIFATGDGWTVSWFDAEGLAAARPRWETLPSPDVSHLSTVGKDVSDDVALGVTPTGSLVAVAPFGAEKAQLGVFLFAPIEPDAPAVKAMGVTHHAKHPAQPAVAADATGYYLAWHEEGNRIASSHFDPAGKETDEAFTIVDAGEAKREGLALASTASGAIAHWIEGGELRARALDKSARPSAPVSTIGKGRWSSIVSAGDGAIVVWVGNDGKADDQLLVARVGPSGAAAAKGLRITGGALGVKDPPSVALAGPRIAFAWTEVMSPTVSSKRAVLRLIDATCLE